MILKPAHAILTMWSYLKTGTCDLTPVRVIRGGFIELLCPIWYTSLRWLVSVIRILFARSDIIYVVTEEHHEMPHDSQVPWEVTCHLWNTCEKRGPLYYFESMTTVQAVADSRWNVMTHVDAREGKWRGNWRMEWVTSTLHTTSEHGVSSITTADAHTSAASSRLNWRPRRFKRTRPFRRKTKSGFCACAITFQLASNTSFIAIS